MSPLRQAVLLAGLWGGILVLLAVLWIQSPFTGSASMFLAWTVPAAVLMGATWIWLDRQGITSVPRGPKVLVAVVVLWGATVAVVVSGVGPELALDGLILRDGARRNAGRALQWLPVAFGALLSMAGLAAALEARYRVRHGEFAGTSPDGTGRGQHLE